jgi:hypothetical protein
VKLSRSVRLAVVSLGVAGGLWHALQRPARASVFESLLGFGERMAPYLDDGRTTETPRAIVLNGQALHVAVGRTPHAPARVKDWYLDRYHSTELAELARSLKGAPPAPATQVAYGDDEEGGMVAFDLGRGLTLDTLRRRYGDFVRSHRLGELGQVRFVRWTRDADGGTRFLTMWTDRGFSLDGLIPPRGVDVAGGDLADAVRPPGMTRVLAMEEVGKPYRMRVYEGRGLASQVATLVAAGMRQRGWREDASYRRQEGTSVGLRFERDQRSVVYDVDESEKGLIDVAVIECRGGV